MEHWKEIKEGASSHPLVVHYIEEHGGSIQEALMRTLSGNIVSLDRQIQESVNILEEMRKEGQCLNLKSEWGGAKIPGLEVRSLKGVTKTRREEGRKPNLR